MKISIITLSFLFSLSSYAECLDFSGEYYSDVYGGTIEEIIQTDCENRTTLVKTIDTNEVIIRFEWKTDGSLQRNLSPDEFIYGLHKEDHFTWNLFHQNQGSVTKAQEFLTQDGDLIRELRMINRNGYERFQRITLPKFYKK